MAVYFIRAGSEAVKIGMATEVVMRLCALQVGNHEELILARVIPGDYTEERRLHRHYADLRIRGDWFRWSDEMMTIDPGQLAPGPVGSQPKDALSKAIEILGGQTQLARATSRTQQAVSLWRRSRVPGDASIMIEKATGGKVMRHQLRPDLFEAA